MSESNNFNVVWEDELASTNVWLKALTQQCEVPEFTVVAAHKQSQGKGQGGNIWESAPSQNLTFSLLLKPDYVEIQHQFVLSKAIALGILDALSMYGVECCIKWPNDVYYKDFKLGGILIENSICHTSISESIIGIGLNINQTHFISDAPNPISLKSITGEHYNLSSVLDNVLSSIYSAIKQVKNQASYSEIDINYFQSLYRNKGLHLYKDHEGVFKASIVEISDFGHLVLKTEDNELKTYAFKEVEFII
jgi:BirA family biotin operon repressor/biotin-[acetyl-CoA-carboxylase] ligase